MKNNFVKNIIFRLISGFVLLFVLALIVYSFIETLKVNKDNAYLINIIGLIGMGLFTVIESFLLFKNIKNPIIFHAVIFNEHNSTINWPAFIVDNVGLLIGIIIETVSLILINTKTDLTIVTSCLVLIPLAAFLISNCLFYNAYLLLFRERKLKVKDLIK